MPITVKKKLLQKASHKANAQSPDCQEAPEQHFQVEKSNLCSKSLHTFPSKDFNQSGFETYAVLSFSPVFIKRGPDLKILTERGHF